MNLMPTTRHVGTTPTFGRRPDPEGGQRGNTRAVELFAEAGMDVNASDEDGSAVVQAVDKGFVEVVTILLGSGARDIDAALRRACGFDDRSRVEIAKLLQRH